MNINLDNIGINLENNQVNGRFFLKNHKDGSFSGYSGGIKPLHYTQNYPLGSEVKSGCFIKKDSVWVDQQCVAHGDGTLTNYHNDGSVTRYTCKWFNGMKNGTVKEEHTTILPNGRNATETREHEYNKGKLLKIKQLRNVKIPEIVFDNDGNVFLHITQYAVNNNNVGRSKIEDSERDDVPFQVGKFNDNFDLVEGRGYHKFGQREQQQSIMYKRLRLEGGVTATISFQDKNDISIDIITDGDDKKITRHINPKGEYVDEIDGRIVETGFRGNGEKIKFIIVQVWS